MNIVTQEQVTSQRDIITNNINSENFQNLSSNLKSLVDAMGADIANLKNYYYTEYSEKNINFFKEQIDRLDILVSKISEKCSSITSNDLTVGNWLEITKETK